MAQLKINYTQSISVLGLESGATVVEIKEAYRKLAKRYHPDIYKLDGGEKFKEVNVAYRFLKENPDPPAEPEYQSQQFASRRRPDHNEYERKRRAYYNRQRKKKENEAAQKEQMFKWLFKKVRLLVFIILIFNSLLAVDYLLPSVEEQVDIVKVNTVRFVTKGKAHYNYRAKLSNGQTFKFGKSEMAKLDVNEPFILSRSTIFKEGEALRPINGDTIIYPDYGLFSVFGGLIPLSISLLLAYLFYVKDNDYKLTIILISFFIFIFQLFLIF